MIDTFLNFKFDSLLALVLYWVPLIFCAVYYTVCIGKDYLFDKRNRELHKNAYFPTLTIGVIVSRVLASIVPLVNLIAAVFDISPVVFKKFYHLLGDIFDQPIVPRITK
jgi:uncharacterized membrane protein YkvI